MKFQLSSSLNSNYSDFEIVVCNLMLFNCNWNCFHSLKQVQGKVCSHSWTSFCFKRCSSCAESFGYNVLGPTSRAVQNSCVVSLSWAILKQGNFCKEPLVHLWMSCDNPEAGIKFCSSDTKIQANADFSLKFILRYECLKPLFQMIFKVHINFTLHAGCMLHSWKRTGLHLHLAVMIFSGLSVL